ncbi:hypothetical protein D922_00061 [Enterococcus faecalis 06-MB-DW-09]|nr:phage head-tail connector protein [Enterococcus innesii]EPH97866.1 hypothetical protein D922_00061 [Enterococcus faecalis 06-MB-DW-09]
MSVTEDVKALLSGTVEEKLAVIEKRTKERLTALLGASDLPKEFESVLYEVTLKRFNRIGQEGMTSFDQEGLKMTFPESDFAEYDREIEAYKRKELDEFFKPRRGRIGFF